MAGPHGHGSTPQHSPSYFGRLAQAQQNGADERFNSCFDVLVFSLTSSAAARTLCGSHDGSYLFIVRRPSIHCALNNFHNDVVAQRDEVGSYEQNDVLLFAIRCDIDAVEEVRRFTAVEREDRVVHDLMTELCGSEGVSPAEREVV